MFKSANKSKNKQRSVTEQSRPTQSAAPRPIQDISQSKTSKIVTPVHEEIAMRAYEIYRERGCPQGQSEEIWLQAEKEVKNRSQTAALSK